MNIEIKSIVDEDFVNYRKPSMYIAFPYCDWKCEKDAGCEMCQNKGIALQKNILADSHDIVRRYTDNPLTEAIIFSGLEPFKSYDQMQVLIKEFREVTDDVIIIYTGYNKEEIFWEVNELEEYDNIIIKFIDQTTNNSRIKTLMGQPSSTADYTTANDIQQHINAGYEIIKDETGGKQPVFGKENKTYSVLMKHKKRNVHAKDGFEKVTEIIKV